MKVETKGELEAGKDLPQATRWARLLQTVVGGFGLVYVAIQVTHLLRPFGIAIPTQTFLMSALGIFLLEVFLIMGASGKPSTRMIPWYDLLTGVAVCSICLYFALQSERIAITGWDFAPPPYVSVLTGIVALAILEAARRTTGNIFAGLVAIFLISPAFASYLPGPLLGTQFSINVLPSVQVLGSEAVLGLPLSVAVGILVGYVLFGLTLQLCGASLFFNGLAAALVGNLRGGAGLISVVASCLVGTITGSAIANANIVGSFTIPAMKASGFEPARAGAVEAVSSSGGIIMPPVMGTIAFVMAGFLGIPYAQVCLIALVPAVLYYFSLFVALFFYAYRRGIGRMPKVEISLRGLMVERGWIYVLSFAVLLYYIFVAKMENEAPYYAVVLMLGLSMIRKKTRISLANFLAFFRSAGRSVSDLVAILAAVGFIMGWAQYTGTAHAMSYELLAVAGGNQLFLLLLGAVVSFVLGMGISMTPIYILLAVLLALALIASGVNILAAHWFIVFTSLFACITPPVAVVAFATAELAQADPMKTALTACRMGIALFILPVFCILSPELLLIGNPVNIIRMVVAVAIGILLLNGGIEGYFFFTGLIKSWILRIVIAASGIMICLPYPYIQIIGVGIAIAAITSALIVRKALMKPRLINGNVGSGTS